MKFYIETVYSAGGGVFARNKILAGEPILAFFGPLLKRAEVREVSTGARRPGADLAWPGHGNGSRTCADRGTYRPGDARQGRIRSGASGGAQGAGCSIIYGRAVLENHCRTQAGTIKGKVVGSRPYRTAAPHTAGLC